MPSGITQPYTPGQPAVLTTHPGHIREVAGEGGGEDRPGESQPAARDGGKTVFPLAGSLKHKLTI